MADLFGGGTGGTNLFANLPPEQPGFGEQLVADTAKSFRAAGFMLGLVKPDSPEEAAELRRRFFADAASLAVGAATGGAGSVALKGVGPVARAILGGALSGAAGGATFTGIDQGDPLSGALGGGALGAAFGGFAGSLAKGQTAARALGSPAAEKPLESMRTRHVFAHVMKPAGEDLVASGKLRFGKRGVGEIIGEQVGRRKAAQEGAERQRFGAGLEGRTTDPFDFMGERSQFVDPFSTEQPPTVAGLPPKYEPRIFHEPLTETPLPTAPEPAWPQSSFLGPAWEQLDLFDVPPAPKTRQLASGITGSHYADQLTATPTVHYGGVTVAPAPPSLAIPQVRELTKDLGPEVRTAGVAETRKAFFDYLRSQGFRPRGKPRLPKGRRVRGRPDLAAPQKTAFEDLRQELGQGYEPSFLATGNSVIEKTLRRLPSGDRFGDAFNDVRRLAARVLLPADVALKKMGATGAALATKMSQVVDRAARIASEDVLEIKQLTKGLSQAQRNHLGEVLAGNTPAKDASTQVIVDRIRMRLDRVAQEASGTNLRELVAGQNRIRPFAYRENYFPLVYPDHVIRKYLEPGPVREKTLQYILNTGQASTKEEAEDLLRRHFVTPPEFRYGHLQVARELTLPDWERDPLKVLPLYFMRAWKRIETARDFGAGDEAAAQAIKALRDEGHDAKLASDIYFAFADKAPRDYGNLVRLTRTFNIVTMLSTAGLLQFAQHGNIIASAGFRNYLKGLGGLMSKEGKEWAATTGAYMQELIQELVPISEDIAGQRSASAFWLRFIGLTPLDKANRMIASLAGYHRATELAARHAAAPSKKLATELARLGLDADLVVRQGGTLTREQLRVAGQQMSHLTQFRGASLDLPALRSTPAGQFMFLFKSFAIQQMRYTHDLLQNARKNGEWGPLLRYLAATGTLTAAVGDASRTLRGRQRPDDPAWAYVEAMLGAGAVGMAYDAMRAVEGGPAWFAGFLAGPTASQVIEFVSRDAVEAAKGNPQLMLHNTLRRFPGIGNHLAEWLIPRGE